MSAEELENWLKTGDSESSGWKNSSDDTETVGHESGTKIVDIIRRNPKKDEDKYTEEDLAHMRKVNDRDPLDTRENLPDSLYQVVSYCKRHLAQEDKLKERKSPEELEQVSAKQEDPLCTDTDHAISAR